MSRLRLAGIHVPAQIAQCAAALVVIALGVGLTGGILLANRALLESARASSAALAGRADLQVRSASGGSLELALVERVRGVPGVAAAAPLLLGSVLPAAPPVEQIAIVGIDLLDDATVRVYRAPDGGPALDDPLALLNQPDSALAPRALATARGLAMGDALVVDAPVGRRSLVVRGLLEDVAIADALGGAFLVLDLYAAQDLLSTPERVSQIDVVLAPDADPVATLAALRSALPPQVAVETIAARRGAVERTVAGLATMLDAIAAMGLALGALITANRLATLYQARSWEIGVLRGMGFTPARLMGELLLEASALSLLGVVVGLPLAIVLARAMVTPVGDMLSLNDAQLLGAPRVVAHLPSLVRAAVAGLLTGLAAAAWPAHRAIRTSVGVLGARRRGRGPSPPRPWLVWVRIVVCLTAIALALASRGSGVFGGLAMVALAAAGVLLLPPLLELVGRVLAPLLGSAAAAGLRDQSRGASRPSGATTILMFGVAVVVWTAATGASFERFVVDTNMATRRGDLIVDGAIDMPAVGEGEPRLAEEVLDALAATPGVAAVGADVYATAHDPEVGIVALDGVRLQDDRFGDWHLEPGALPDALARVARGEAVLADRSFADGNELRVGDVVRLTTPSGVLERPLAGITRPTFVSSAGDVVLERRVYRDAWHDQTINRAYVLLEDGASPEVVRERIRDGAGRRFRLRVTDMQTHASWLADSVRRGFAFVDAMAVIMLLVVLIGTGDALASNVGERTRELGTLRAMGYTPRALAQMILAQGLAVGVTGSALAVVVGMAMSVAFVSGVLPATLGWQLALDPTYGLAALVAVLGVVASVLGAVLPAVRAARIPVATVLRWE